MDDGFDFEAYPVGVTALDPATLSIPAGPYRLRPTCAADRAGIVRAGQAPAIGGKMPWFPTPFPEHYADDWIARAIATWGRGQHWVLSIVDANEYYLGSVVLSRLASGTLELSYWVLPDATHRGVATMAARAAVAWSREALQPPGYFAKARRENAASRRVLAKIGFVETGETDGALTYALD